MIGEEETENEHGSSTADASLKANVGSVAEFSTSELEASVKSLLHLESGGEGGGGGGGGGGGEESVKSDGSQQRFILMLTIVAGIGGFIFGVDTGVISGALLYIRDDFPSVGKSVELQEFIVSSAILGAAVGAAVGGQVNDIFGRKIAILGADFVFALGALLMALSSGPFLLIVGRVLVGLGVGVASMTVPLYIAEASPAKIRGALVSVNVLMITSGQFVSYVVNVAFSGVPGTWRWMLGMAGIPAILQAILMIPLPESPRWLFKQGRAMDAVAVMRKLRTETELKTDLEEMVEAEAMERQKMDSGEAPKLYDLVATPEMRMALTAGVGLQVFQQFVGINTVMYYSPSIVELAGYASHKTALLLSLFVAGMNAVGTIAGMVLIDRCGRRKLVLSSLVGVILALSLLGTAFHYTAFDSPPVQSGILPGGNGTECTNLENLGRRISNCLGCLDGGCGFCAASGDQMSPGVCLEAESSASYFCSQENRAWFTKGCPSHYGVVALAGLVLYIAAFAPGMGPVPWAVNSEIYPLKLRGLAGGVAATANWIANLVVAQTFLTMVKYLGTSVTFYVFGVIAILAFLFIYFFLPETKGLSFKQVDQMWEARVREGAEL